MGNASRDLNVEALKFSSGKCGLAPASIATDVGRLPETVWKCRGGVAAALAILTAINQEGAMSIPIELKSTAKSVVAGGEEGPQTRYGFAARGELRD